MRGACARPHPGFSRGSRAEVWAPWLAFSPRRGSAAPKGGILALLSVVQRACPGWGVPGLQLVSITACASALL